MDVDHRKQAGTDQTLGSKDAPIIIDEDMDSPIETGWIRPPMNQVEDDSVLRYLSYIVKATHAQGLREDAERGLKSYKDQYRAHSKVRTEVATKFGLPDVLWSGATASWVDGRSVRSNNVRRVEDEMITSVEGLHAFSSSQEGEPSIRQLAIALQTRNQRLRDGILRSSVLSAQEDLRRIRNLHQGGTLPQATPPVIENTAMVEVTDPSQPYAQAVIDLQDRLDAIWASLEEAEEWATASFDETREAMRTIVEEYPFETFNPESDGETTITDPSQDADQQALEELRLAKSTFDERQGTCKAYSRLFNRQTAKSKDDQEKILEATAKLESSTSTLDTLDTELAALLADVTKNTSRSFSIEDSEKKRIFEEAKEACNASLQTNAVLADLNPQFMASRSSMLHFHIPDSRTVGTVREGLDAAHQVEFKKLQDKASQGIAHLLARGRDQQERLEREYKWP